MKYSLSDVSLVLPSRTNLKYLKWAYNSIRTNLGNDIWVCMADDASTDDTWTWMQEVKENDSRVKVLQNPGPNRKGHTLLYDEIVYKLVETPLAVIAHADMWWLPNSITNMLKHMGPKTIVSATRIEPDNMGHPPGKEKYLLDMGLEPEFFDEGKVRHFAKEHEKMFNNVTTAGVFAPWMFFVEDFKEINGHDPLFRPQSREDDDIWNRFLLNGIEFIQSRDAFVAHLTCRGSRRNPTTTPNVKQDSNEWAIQNRKSERNYVRKWGKMPLHDELHHPILSNKYNIGIRAENTPYELLGALEPWCDRIYTDAPISQYISHEQSNTDYDLTKRVHSLTGNDRYDYEDILVEVDGRTFTQEDYSLIQSLTAILDDSGEVGAFMLGNLKITINQMKTYTHELIICDS